MYDGLNLQNKGNLASQEHLKKLGSKLKEGRKKGRVLSIGAYSSRFLRTYTRRKGMSLKEPWKKVTITFFGCMGCKPCRLKNPNVVNVYE